MRRLIGVLPAGALVAALCCGFVRADVAPITVPHIDVSASLFAQVFSEPVDRAAAAFPALAFHVALPDSVVTIPNDVMRVAMPSFTDSAYAQPSFAPAPVVSAAYAPNAAQTESGKLATTTFVLPSSKPLGLAHDGNTLGFSIPVERRFELSSYSPVQAETMTLPQQQSAVSMPVRIGHVDLISHAVASQAQTPDLNLNDSTFNAGATFNLHAGKRIVGLDVSGTNEHLSLNTPASVSLAGDDAQLFAPSFADVNRRTLGTALTVPISHRLTGSLQFDSEHLLGGYGAPGLSNLDANNTVLGARLTYQLPKSSNAAISLSAKEFHYQDNLVPTNTFNQASANVDFTVKF